MHTNKYRLVAVKSLLMGDQIGEKNKYLHKKIINNIYYNYVLELQSGVYLQQIFQQAHMNTKEMQEEMAEHEKSCMSEKHEHNPFVCRKNGRVESHSHCVASSLVHTPSQFTLQSSKYCTPDILEARVCVADK